MDMSSFSSKYNLKLNINDSSIKADDIINSLYHNLEILWNESKTSNNKANNSLIDGIGIEKADILSENLNLFILDESVNRKDVIESLSTHLLDVTSPDRIKGVDNLPNKNEVNDSLIDGVGIEMFDVLSHNLNLSILDESVNRKDVIGSLSSHFLDIKSKDGIRFIDDSSNINIKSSDEASEPKQEFKTFSDYVHDTAINGENDAHKDENLITQVKKKIKINQASEEELKSIPGIRLVQAKKIIQLRRYNTYINSFEDLQEKIGVREEDLNQLKSYIIIDEEKTNKRKYVGRILDI